jgi:hypothetical protein
MYDILCLSGFGSGWTEGLLRVAFVSGTAQYLDLSSQQKSIVNAAPHLDHAFQQPSFTISLEQAGSSLGYF